MSDWAYEKADQFLCGRAEMFGYYGRESATGERKVASLAALLREVAGQRFYRPAPLRVEDLLDGLPRLSTPEQAVKVMGDGQALVKMREIK